MSKISHLEMSKRPVSVTHDAELDMPTGLIRRAGGMYSTRRRTPLALVPHYRGKAEVVRALGTNNPTEARRLHALMWVRLDQEFDAARQAVAEAAASRPPGPSPEWLAKTPEQRAEYERQADWYEADYNEWQEQDGLDAEHNPERHARTAERQALRAEWEAEKAEERAASKAEKVAEKRAKAAIPLSVVADKWAAEQKPGHRAETRARKVIEDFEALNGKLTVQAVTKQHVLAYKDALIAEGQSPANANLLIGWVGTMLIFARDKLHLIEVNPAANIRLTDKRRDKDKRRAFGEAELTAIFESPVYANALRPAAGGGEAAYWLPLLSLYTGARQTELGQLHPDDVRQEAYRDADDKEQSAWVLRIVENAERGQQVKNEGSERRIPIHADLIALGFVTMAQQALAQGRSRIFPDIVPNSVKVLMGNWSKWFGRYRRKECGLPGKDTPFHSFRHTFKHHARLVGIPNEIHNEFTGHETGDVADTYGGLSYPLRPLVEGMKRYRVEGFTLPAPPPALPA
jgi:integrase